MASWSSKVETWPPRWDFLTRGGGSWEPVQIGPFLRPHAYIYTHTTRPPILRIKCLSEDDYLNYIFLWMRLKLGGRAHGILSIFWANSMGGWIHIGTHGLVSISIEYRFLAKSMPTTPHTQNVAHERPPRPHPESTNRGLILLY